MIMIKWNDKQHANSVCSPNRLGISSLPFFVFSLETSLCGSVCQPAIILHKITLKKKCICIFSFDPGLSGMGRSCAKLWIIFLHLFPPLSLPCGSVQAEHRGTVHRLSGTQSRLHQGGVSVRMSLWIPTCRIWHSKQPMHQWVYAAFNSSRTLKSTCKCVDAK